MNDSLLFQWKRKDILKSHRSKCFHKKFRIHYFLFAISLTIKKSTKIHHLFYDFN